MTRTLNVAFASLATLFLLSAGATGCKVSACPDTPAVDGGKPVTRDNCLQFEPTREYDGTVRTANGAWSTGMGVTITNRNGSLTVTSDSTSATEVQVSGIPFTRDGTSEADQQAAVARINAMAFPSVTAGGTGVVVDAPGGGFDGYKLTVRLPPGFDGVLVANNGNGELTYSGTPSSVGNKVHTDNGDVNASVGTGAKVTATAKTEFGTVVFTGPWTMPMISADQTSGTAVLGDGTGTIEGSTGNGDVFFTAR